MLRRLIRAEIPEGICLKILTPHLAVRATQQRAVSIAVLWVVKLQPQVHFHR